MTSAALSGGCFCGAVRYQASGVFDETICHCAICRRTTGAPLVAWFSVRRTDFRLQQGALTHFRSSKIAERGFCAVCGTQITFQFDDRADEIDVTIGSLDEPERVPPVSHTFTSSRIGWIRLCDGLPQYMSTKD